MDISIIIPTMATETRAPFLIGALRSLFAQSEHRAVPIVVVNGTSYMPDFLDALRRDTRLRVVYREEAGEMAAVVAGRQTVDTEYFGVLDDDDIYLPNAFEVRVAALREATSAHAVVTNGFRRTESGDAPFLEDFGQISADPLLMLLRRSWMTPAGATFRADAVSAEIFASAPPMLEYTYLGLRVASAGKVCFIDKPTFVKQDLLADAITRTKEYVLLQPSAIEHLMTLPLPPHLRHRLKEKVAASRHHVSTAELNDGHLSKAWRAHLGSMLSIYGLRYLSYTRHLLGPFKRSAIIVGQLDALLFGLEQLC